MSKEAEQFVFMTCRVGAEAALKQEVARSQPDWRLAFSRPGFLTFKQAEGSRLGDKELAERSWTFAHCHGISLGRIRGTGLASMVEELWQRADLGVIASTNPQLDLHVWQREPVVGGNGGETLVSPIALEVEAALRAAAPTTANMERTLKTQRKASPRNSIVIDVVLVEPGEWWVGYHRAVRRIERWPGGAIPVRMPAHAVSRAYLKLQEAIQWSDLPLAPEDECVEIGCAPGGASQALLDRGMFVTGIDPADVEPVLLQHPRFRHLKKRGTEVRRQEFVGVRWLVVDMNIAPEHTLDDVEAIVKSPQVALRGLVLTLKFADWSAGARIPEFVGRVRRWGFRDVRTRQLVSGGQEVCLVALRRKALRRLAGKRARRTKSVDKSKTPDQRCDGPHSLPIEPHF